MQIFSLREVPVRVWEPSLFKKDTQAAREVGGRTTGSDGRSLEELAHGRSLQEKPFQSFVWS